MVSSLSVPKMRIRSSSSDRKNLECPGSPCRPERPRNWLSMRRLSCRSVPSTNSPPATSAFSLSRTTLVGISSARGSCSRARVFDLGQFLPDAHVGFAAERDGGAAPGHVGGDRHRPGHPRLPDDVDLLLVVGVAALLHASFRP